jgi:hypothetical protein
VAPAPRRFWLRTQIFEEVLVERLPDGTLREVNEHSVPKSQLEQVGLTSPTAERGLGLYVQKGADIHADGIGGPVIGRVSPGAYLPVVAVRDDVAEVVLSRYGRKDGSEPHAFMAASALGVDVPAALPPPVAAESVDYLDIEAELRLTPGGTVVARTACGPVHVVERSGSDLRVAQEHDGIRVVAWITAPEGRRGSHRCLRVIERRLAREREEWTPRVPVLPPGYVRIPTDIAGHDPLEPMFRRGGVIYWLVPNAQELSCKEWRVRPKKNRPDDAALEWPVVRAELTHPTTVDTDPPFGAGGLGLSAVGERLRNEPPVPRFQHVTLVFDAAFTRGRGDSHSSMDLEGPEERGARPQPGHGVGIALCGNSENYTIVGTHVGSVTVLAGGTHLTVAYHPEDAESWYLSRAACEADRAALSRGPLSSAHLHRGRGC